MTKQFLYGILVAILTLTACHDKGKCFTIQGTIHNAADSMLILEALPFGLPPQGLDSIRLGEDGDFSLNGPAPQTPEFYRLRIGERIVNLSIDSTETISLRADLRTLESDYNISGSGNCDTIRLLTQLLARLNTNCKKIANDRSLSLQKRDSLIMKQIRQYKEHIKLNFIQNRYDKASSYYALFQSSHGSLVFNPLNDAGDVTWTSAVANAWQERWPQAQRTKNLVSIAMRGRANTRQHVINLDLDNKKISESGIIDMGFPDLRGTERRLSQLKGHVVLLDFTAYGLPDSQQRTMALRKLYEHYHTQGLEIYQVGLDTDEHYWKTMCSSLPWICVWNPGGTANDIVRIYNVQQIPTWFLVDRNSNLVGRQEALGELEDEIRRLL